MDCFEHMLSKGIALDAITYGCILKTCGIVKDTETGKGLLKKNSVLRNSVVDMYASCGALQKAQKVLEELPVCSLVSWSALIARYTKTYAKQEYLPKCNYLCSCISWLSKKQPIVATSSCEAEYRTVFTGTVECVWLRRLMADLGVGQDTANTIYTDSQSALAVMRNPFFHARIKHIEVHYHYVRERLSTGEISLAYVPTQDNLADLFTKALSREKLEAFYKALGLLPFVD
ncbi:hypothetical protein L7F22_059618 [Adiantum nelumboides]|nr:hypothetical protein [Adiantum nelumboides]